MAHPVRAPAQCKRPVAADSNSVSAGPGRRGRRPPGESGGRNTVRTVTAIDLFCGAGGLSEGLKQAGVTVAGGIDLDPSCKYAFESNIGASFVEEDVRTITADRLRTLWGDASVRLLAGCAPCQPFSPYRRGIDTSKEEEWPLLAQFGRLVSETKPELVTMENVPRIGRTSVFAQFVEILRAAGYDVDWRSCYGPDYGLPQSRRRLVLVASLLGPLAVPDGPQRGKPQPTVREAIGDLPQLDRGCADPGDVLHKSRALSETNLKRMRASRPGGTWEDWPEELRAPCHRKKTGSSFRNVYARMEWDKPAPTITTLSYSFGTGRFGHPEQDRSISLREAAMLQGFPGDYRFVESATSVHFAPIGRMIGNAVPPPLAKVVGEAMLTHVNGINVAAPSE
ncbi:MAG: DNA cytosine methyltransferase [Candidatus Dormibacteria bacterium]